MTRLSAGLRTLALLTLPLAMGAWGSCEGKPHVSIKVVGPSSGLLADGFDGAQVQVQFTGGDSANEAAVKLEVEGEGVTVTPPRQVAYHQDPVTFFVTSTVPGVKTLRPVDPDSTDRGDSTAQVEFVASNRPPPKLAFKSAPSSAVAGERLGPVEVEFLDEHGARFPSQAVVLLKWEDGSDFLDGQGLPRVVNLAAKDGIATFPGERFCQPEGPARLVASVGAAQATSEPVAILPGAVIYAFLEKSGEHAYNIKDSVGLGIPYEIDLVVQDTCFNRATNFRGTIGLAYSGDSPVDPAASLPSAAFTAEDAGTHRFSVVFNTKGTYRLQPSRSEGPFKFWNLLELEVLDDRRVLDVGALPSSTIAGQALDLSARVVDGEGDPVAGDVLFASSDPQATLPSGGFSGTCTGCLVFRTAGQQTLTATWGSLSETQEIVVKHADADSFVVAGPPDPISVDTPFAVTLSARDAFGNPATTYAGTVHLTADDPLATLPADPTFSPADQGTKTVSGLVLTWAGARQVTATATGAARPTGSTIVQVLGGSAIGLVIDGITNPVDAGAPLPVTVRAKDKYGNAAAAYRGSVVLVTNDPRAALVPTSHNYTAQDLGEFVFQVTFKTVGSWNLTAGDHADASLRAAFDPVVVRAGPPALLSFLASPAAAEVGQPFSPAVSVLVTDLANNPIGDPVDVTLALGANAAGASLSGTLTRTTVMGIARFADVALDKQGQGFTLLARSPGLVTAESSPFDGTCLSGYTGATCTECESGLPPDAQGHCVSPCDPNPCTTPPADTCKDLHTLRQQPDTGTCDPYASADRCSYTPEEVPCGSGRICFEGACIDDPCAGVTCQPNAPSCDANGFRVTWTATCVATGSTTTQCSQSQDVAACPSGERCEAGACVPDEWIAQQGVAGQYSVTKAVARDADGNVYAVGQTGGAFGGTPAIGLYDAFVMKYSSGGAVQWLEKLGEASRGASANAVVVTRDALFVVGETDGVLPGQTRKGTSDLFIARYGLNGTREWVQQYGVSGQLTYGKGLAVDSSGALYAVGATHGNFGGQTCLGNQDAFVAKFDSAGVQGWTALLGASGSAVSIARGVAVAGGQVTMVGETTGSLDGSTVTGGKQWMFVAAYDAATGGRSWLSMRGLTTADTRARAVMADAAGVLYVAGDTKGMLDGRILHGVMDAVIVKYAANGTWDRTRLMGEAGTASSGSGIAMGESWGADAPILVGNTTGTFFSVPGIGTQDGFIYQADTALAPLWQTRLVGAAGATTEINSVVLGPKHIVVGGASNGALVGSAAAGASDMFVATYQAWE